MLEPDQFALHGSSYAKFVSLPLRRMLGPHPSRSFVEILKGQVQPRAVTQSQHITTKDKVKNLIKGESVEAESVKGTIGDESEIYMCQGGGFFGGLRRWWWK